LWTNVGRFAAFEFSVVTSFIGITALVAFIATRRRPLRG
jgi:hypothetical protein